MDQSPLLARAAAGHPDNADIGAFLQYDKLDNPE
jgi:hypothetical protein